ncbi:MAG: DUF433 domain-containing protein [candidate division KSB1 bacterium]|nr:DUF433 domain-containing protein [candidate division KSB1 bacterium]MDZ7366670.1 DUF433 domain-containing protein [candidate division KSB1 bacterium]MDZ7404680.1 DUF433 domain-containing protein [candidate division KSB1 bacterium]
MTKKQKDILHQEKLLKRIKIDPKIRGGKSCIRGTRIDIAIILDGLAEGLISQQLVDHYPQLKLVDIRVALAYAAELSRENIWKN